MRAVFVRWLPRRCGGRAFPGRYRQLVPSELLECRRLLAADVFISEVLAANDGIIFDEDGDSSDVVEIFNGGPDDVQLDGWYLTDRVDDADKWAFPPLVLPANASLLVFASGKDRAEAGAELHTNFAIDAGGEYLALSRDGDEAIEVVSSFDPTVPQLPADVSYGVVQSLHDQVFLAADTAVSRYIAPASVGGATDWTTVTYDDSAWWTGRGGLGYATFLPGFTVRDVKASRIVDGLNTAIDVLRGQGDAQETVRVMPVVNFWDPGGGGGVGNFANDLVFPNDGPGNDDDFVVYAAGVVELPESGIWTFGTNSDDGTQLLIDGRPLIVDDSIHDPTDQLGRVSLGAGQHLLELVYFERAGGAEVELFAAEGAHFEFSQAFRLVGDAARGGLPVRTPELPDGAIAGFDRLIDTDVSAVMLNRSPDLYVRMPFATPDLPTADGLTLHVQYDDGFVGYLNGHEIVRRNAPAVTAAGSAALTDRPEQAALVAEAINLADFADLLNSGDNVLAFHVLNDSAGSNEFLFRAELSQLSVTNGPLRFFSTPTPGSLNTTPPVDGFLWDEILFSHPHGFYEASFQLEIDTVTAGTVVRYTLDGSEPTESHGVMYQGAITVSGSTIIRARAFRDGYEPSHVATATYLFLEDVLQQSPTGQAPAGFPGSRQINGQTLDYGMDPDIVNHPTWGPQLRDALRKVPSMSLVMDIDDLLSAERGIYTNASRRGRGWERPASLELLEPDGTEGFQVNAGVRIRGGFSRSSSNPKHAFRFFFRDEYGPGMFTYPLFGDEGVSTFDGFDLRTTQNYSWAFRGDAANTFLRDVFARDVQREMGQPYTRSRYYHLYINGQYWGLYQTQERAEASFAASYLGGDPEDYDVVKSTGSVGGYQNEATDGNLDAYGRLASYFYQPGGLSDANSADYWEAQGMNPDGTRNLAYERLLDVDNLIDYVIGTYYQGERDAPVSRFVPERVNNYFGIYNRENPDGFKFFEHDSEHTLDQGWENLVAAVTSSGREFRYFNPLWMHEQLAEVNSQYRLRFADRVYRHFYHDGPLAPDHARALLQSRIAEFDLAMVAESARWGDARRSPPRDFDDWRRAVDRVLEFVTDRNDIVLQQLRDQGWYPSPDPPQFTVGGELQHGGTVLAGDPVGLVLEQSVAETVLLPSGSSWSYWDQGTDQGTAWRELDFDDGAWAQGRAEFGYGDGDEVTEISFGEDPFNRHPTTYFRTVFHLSDLQAHEFYRLRLLRDDGAVVYLNGREIVRTGMPAGEITYDTLANQIAGGAAERTFFEFEIDRRDLRAGTNLLAVEIHQATPTNSDLSFDLEFVGARFVIPPDSVFYTLDGSDPLLPDGMFSPTAISYTEPLRLESPATLTARHRQQGVWSAVTQARFFVNSVVGSGNNLRITEVNYHPHDALLAFGEIDADDNDFEFIELTNVSEEIVDLSGMRFVETVVAGDTQGVRFQFAPQSLSPGERVVVVRNRLAFQDRYGRDVRIAAGTDPLGGHDGEFGGGLSNSGEMITLVNAAGGVIEQFAYDDRGAWPGRADGGGSSLQLVNFDGDPADASSWDSSVEFGGSPGAAGLLQTATIVVNEILAHTDLPAVDAIELYNTTGAAIDLSGWYLSDSKADYFKYRFPVGSSMAAGAYRVLTEADFNPGAGAGPADFALGSTGDDVWLLQADPDSGRPLRFVDHVEFAATFNGTTVGRFPNGSEDDTMVPLAAPTLGTANLAYDVSSVVISEIHYLPDEHQGLETEFVELTNVRELPVDLSGWRLRGGVDFDIPAGTVIPAGGSVVVIAGDPDDPQVRAAFAEVYATPASLQLLGPWELGDTLDNGGESLRLLQPDDPPAGESSIPHVVRDLVRYDDDPPWPASADGRGNSLQRTAANAFGRFVDSWQAAPPTPGSFGPVAPLVGDINGDLRVDIADVDALAVALANSATNPAWDLDSDGTVSARDRTFLLQEILAVQHGDLDLDGDVDSLDLLTMLGRWSGDLESGVGDAQWSDGDIDGDLDVDSRDLLLLVSSWTGAAQSVDQAFRQGICKTD